MPSGNRSGRCGIKQVHEVRRKKSGHVPDFLHPDPAAVGGVIRVSNHGFYGTMICI